MPSYTGPKLPDLTGLPIWYSASATLFETLNLKIGEYPHVRDRARSTSVWRTQSHIVRIPPLPCRSIFVRVTSEPIKDAVFPQVSLDLPEALQHSMLCNLPERLCYITLIGAFVQSLLEARGFEVCVSKLQIRDCLSESQHKISSRMGAIGCTFNGPFGFLMHVALSPRVYIYGPEHQSSHGI
jgi:hypothetical protein